MNIVIADDEQIILRWLKKNLEELSPEYQVTEACMNGKQVLNCCLNKPVDVLFTDIRMPVMDGLELLEKLKANGIMPYTVILSAYSDFSYVRDAFKLGASDYLLKTEITRESLKQCLDHAAEHIAKNTGLEEKKDSEKPGLLSVLEQFFQTQQETSVDWKQYEQQFQELCGIPYRVLLLHGYESTLNPEQIREMTDLLFVEKRQRIQTICRNEKEMILLLPSDEDTDLEALQHCSEYLSAFGMKDVLICSGDSENSVGDLQSIWEHLQKLAHQLQFYKKTGLFDLRTCCMRRKTAEAELEALYRSLRNELENGTSEQMYAKADAMLQCICRGMIPVEMLKEKMIDFLLYICWNHMDDEQRTQHRTAGIFSLNDAQKIDSFWQGCISWLEMLKQFLDEKKNQKRYSEAVEKVIAYISEHYGSEISLNDLAGYVHLNRSYLSTCFKKEVGENINAFLLNYRLERAKELLMSTNEKVQNICNEVGIPDSAYFSKQFKKYTGETPLEWRKVHK